MASKPIPILERLGSCSSVSCHCYFDQARIIAHLHHFSLVHVYLHVQFRCRFMHMAYYILQFFLGARNEYDVILVAEIRNASSSNSDETAFITVKAMRISSSAIRLKR